MVTKRKLELLAPCKDKYTAFAAIESGADAIYIGAVNFGARKSVGNSLEDIKEVVDYAHKFYVKVHVTINTILTDDELSKAKELIHKLYEIGVDAIIVQDMGIIELAVKGELPPIPIHTSTQCDTRTLEKAEFFHDLGVSRIILARELSLDDIEKICTKMSPLPLGADFGVRGNAHTERDVTPAECQQSKTEGGRRTGEGCTEVETFIHGALCVSYSGQCYLSQSIGGRSANKGECAQPCRKKYSLVDEQGNFIAKDKHLLSLKDFNASRHIERLVKAGVKSFKIEGRLKDINYVRNVVAYYRNILDNLGRKSSSGQIFMDFEPDVNKSFNRGFCEYFLPLTRLPGTLSLKGRGKNIFNFDTPKAMGEKVGTVTRTGKDFFEVKTKIQLNNQDGLCFMLGGHLEGCLVNKVENNRVYPNRMNGIKIGTEIFRNQDVQFEKLLSNSKIKRRIGMEVNYRDGVITVIDDNKNLAQIETGFSEEPKNQEKMKETFIKQMEKTGDSDFFARQVRVLSDLPFLPISVINELRRNLLEKLMAERVKNYKREFQKPLEHTVFPVQMLDYRANVHNQTAKEFYENCGCEVCEMSVESGTKPVELMRTKHCLKFAFDMCKSEKNLFLIDEKGKKYPLQFDCEKCEMAILES